MGLRGGTVESLFAEDVAADQVPKRTILQLVRARLEGRGQAAGLRVTGSVSRLTAALVTDGANPNTTKALPAREHRTRVVTPEVFADLVRYIQPAVTAAVLYAAAGATTVEPVEPTVGAVDPATIRAWARQKGRAVGVRGRIPADVLAAYRDSQSG